MKVDLKTILVGVVIAVLCYFAFIKKVDNSELNLYKQEREKEMAQREAKFKEDSLILVNRYNVVKMASDSATSHWNNESLKMQKIIKGYERKYKYIQVAPIGVVDKQLDSILSGH